MPVEGPRAPSEPPHFESEPAARDWHLDLLDLGPARWPPCSTPRSGWMTAPAEDFWEVADVGSDNDLAAAAAILVGFGPAVGYVLGLLENSAFSRARRGLQTYLELRRHDHDSVAVQTPDSDEQTADRDGEEPAAAGVVAAESLSGGQGVAQRLVGRKPGPDRWSGSRTWAKNPEPTHCHRHKGAAVGRERGYS